MKEQELSNEDVVKNLLIVKEQEITELRNDKIQANETESKKDLQKYETFREMLELQRKTQIHEIEERKNG